MKYLPLAALSALFGCASMGARSPAAEPVLSPREALTADIDSMLSAPQFANAFWGVLIVDPASGDTLYSHNAGKLLMPASNMKIVTGAVALEQLGPDHRFATTIAARRSGSGSLVSEGVLNGDLVVIGRGDPSVSDRVHGDAMIPLRAIADSLAARGVRRIAGQLIADGSALEGPELGSGWAWDDLDYPYSAGVSALYLNDGFTRIVVTGGAGAGEPATVRTYPAATLPTVAARIATVPRPSGGAEIPNPVIVRDSASGYLMLSGAVAAGDSVVLSLTYADQQAAYLGALAEALAARGISIGGGAEPHPETPPTVTDSLFTMLSPPLSEIMPALQKPSQNQIAELFVRALALENTGVGSADSGRRVIERQLREWGVDSLGFAVRDGSGLSRHNYLTPETIVRVLAAMQAHPDFQLFYDALPLAGVDGTIRNRMQGTPAQGNVRAKTGYIDRARALSGYVTTADGRQLIFVAIANNWTTSVRTVEQVQDAIAVRLASLTLD